MSDETLPTPVGFFYQLLLLHTPTKWDKHYADRVDATSLLDTEIVGNYINQYLVQDILNELEGTGQKVLNDPVVTFDKKRCTFFCHASVVEDVDEEVAGARTARGADWRLCHVDDSDGSRLVWDPV